MPEKKMTAEMKAALREALSGDASRVKKGTLSALVRRGFMEKSGDLTLEGWRNAVASLKLPDQCAQLDISLEIIEGVQFGNEPERTAWSHYKQKGYEGGYCEGGPVLLLIRAAALDLFANLNPFGSREDACSRFTEAQLKIHEGHISEIAAAVEAADRDTVLRGFREIYRSLMVQEAYPELTEAAIGSIFTALGGKALREITRAIAEDPYQYRAGWPDLTLAKGEDMLWVEVKTTDKLHMSQIITMTKMKPLLPGKLLVLQLAKL
ncbi:VRR-NUC domain-containing protein [Salinisphaera sp. SPP-AMP-43]|uniref:VRR-NUC domain-containing protein n=1 Tax=Salinisphaera sp. SPP-AMP-43 TaxID=3121288 RepID=UPI003C6E8104